MNPDDFMDEFAVMSSDKELRNIWNEVTGLSGAGRRATTFSSASGSAVSTDFYREYMTRAYEAKDDPLGYKAYEVRAKEDGTYRMEKITGSADGAHYTYDGSAMTKTAEYKEEPTGAGLAPGSGWRMTSVRWLEEKHPEYMRGDRSISAASRLMSALAAMSYLKAEEEFGKLPDGTDAASNRADMVNHWGEHSHRAMTEFLKDGGYKARVEELKECDETDLGMLGSDEVLHVVENGPGAPARSGKSAHVPAPKSDDDGSTVDEAVQYASDLAGSW